jgi:hypothetical protein
VRAAAVGEVAGLERGEHVPRAEERRPRGDGDGGEGRAVSHAHREPRRARREGDPPVLVQREHPLRARADAEVPAQRAAQAGEPLLSVAFEHDRFRGDGQAVEPTAIEGDGQRGHERQRIPAPGREHDSDARRCCERAESSAKLLNDINTPSTCLLKELLS